MAATEQSVIDDSALAELLELDRMSGSGVFVRVVRIFLDQTPEILRSLEAGVSENDAERIFTAAHSLKSSSMNVGAATLSACCKKLEALGRAGTLAGAPTLLAQISNVYEAVEVELEARIAARG